MTASHRVNSDEGSPNRPLTLSVVIPVFNEETAIGACLDALLAHPELPQEIVVVDNNSTDASRHIVEEYARSSDRIRLLTESRQGLVPTRDHGIREARGDIIARIDADTVVSSDWARSICDFFAVVDDDIAGGHGLCTMHDMPWQAPFRSVQQKVVARTRRRLADGSPTIVKEIFGANQVMRASAWRQVAGRTTDRTDIMEDTDLSITVAGLGLRLALIPGMEAEISGRRLRSSPLGYWRYTACSPRTYAIHKRYGSAVGAWFGIQLARIVQLFFWVALRRWDPVAHRFSWRGPAQRETERVIP